MRKYLAILMVLTLFSLFFVSCRQAEPLAPEEPIVTLLAPSQGSTMSSGDVQVRIYLQNFKLTPDIGQANRPGEGHIIYYLDASAPLAATTPATTAANSFKASSETSYTWSNVPPGKHTFWVQLVNNDDTPLLPPVAVRATVTLK